MIQNEFVFTHISLFDGEIFVNVVVNQDLQKSPLGNLIKKV